MKTIKLLSLSFFVFGALLFSSCKKEGCTNPEAENYDAEAKISDKSCQYKVDVVFWFEEATSNALVNADIKKIDFELNEEPLGSASTEQFWEEAPECDDANTIKFTKDLEKAPFEPFYYTVKDKDGNQLLKGIVQLDTDSCRVIKLDDF